MADINDKFEKFIKDASRKFDKQDALLNLIADKVDLQNRLTLAEITERKESKEEKKRREPGLEGFVKTRKEISDNDDLGVAGLKGLFALVAQLNPITALIYQHANVLLNTFRGLGNLAGGLFRGVGNTFLAAKDLAGRGINSVSNLFGKSQESLDKALPAKTDGTAVGLLNNRQETTQNIDSFQADKVSSLNVANAAAVQLKIHQAMIWADQAVIIPKQTADTKSNSVAGLLENKTSIKNSSPEIPETESNAVKTSRTLSQGFAGLSESLKKNTEKLKELAGPAILIAAGIGLATAAILGLVAWLKNKGILSKPENPNEAEAIRKRAEENTLSQGMDFNGINTNTMSDYIGSQSGRLEGVIGRSDNGVATLTRKTGAGDFSVNVNDLQSVSLRTTKNKLTPVVLTFDGECLGITPMTGLKDPMFEIAFFTEKTADYIGNKDKLFFYRGIVNPNVVVGESYPKGYVIGFSKGAFTALSRNEKIIDGLEDDLKSFEDNNYQAVQDILKERRDGDEVNALNKQQTSMLKDNAKQQTELNHPIANAALKGMGTGAALGAGAGLALGGAPAIPLALAGGAAGGVTGALTAAYKVADYNISNIVDNATKNGIQADNNTDEIRRTNAVLQNNSNNNGNEKTNSQIITPAGGGSKVNSVVFAPDDPNDILNISGPYTDATPEI